MKRYEPRLLAWTLILFALVLLLVPLRPERTEKVMFRVDSVHLEIGEQRALPYVLELDSVPEMEFSSSAPLIVSVDQSGVATGISPGTARIMLRAGAQLETSMRVTVAGVPVSQLTLDTDALTMQKGQRSRLNAQVNRDATDPRIYWFSEDEGVVAVSEDGQLDAVGGGSARVTATSVNGLKAEALVRVEIAAESVRVAPEKLVLGVGAEIPLRAAFVPADSTEEVAAWESTDESVLTVDDSGVLRAVGVGQARVRLVTRSALAAYAEVAVEEPAARVEVLPGEATVARGGKIMLAAAIEPASCTDHEVLWESDAPEIAQVDEGEVRAVSAGSAQICAVVDGVRSAPCRISVRILPESVRLNVREYALTTETLAPLRLTAQVLPEDAEDRTAVFSSDNAEVAQVSAEGIVSFTGKTGIARISAKAVNGLEDVCVITVTEPQP